MEGTATTNGASDYSIEASVAQSSWRFIGKSESFNAAHRQGSNTPRKPRRESPPCFYRRNFSGSASLEIVSQYKVQGKLNNLPSDLLQFSLADGSPG